MGEKACTCIPGAAAFTERTMSAYAVAFRSGEIPPCRHTSVAPSACASAARSPDLVQRERVGVGVGLALGERAEPATDVADVGEVDVPVHDVGDVVPDRVPPQLVGEGGHGVEVGAVSGEQRQVVVVAEPRGVVLRRDPAPHGRRCRGAARPAPSTRAATSCQSPYTSSKSLRRSALRPSSSTPRWRSTRPVPDPVAAMPPSGSCHTRPTGRASSRARPVAGSTRARDVRVQPGVDPRLVPLQRTEDEPRVGGEPLGQRQPRLGRPPAQVLDLGPGTLGVHVVGRHRGDTAPVVDTGREQARDLLRVREIGRGLHRHGRTQQQPGDGDRREVLLLTEVRRAAHRRVLLGPEVLHDALLHRAVLAARRDGSPGCCRARSWASSPMPTRMPVVNGTPTRPASSSTRSRTAGSLSGEPKWACPGSVNSRVEVVSSIIPSDGATGFSRCRSDHVMTPGLRCGSSPVSSSTRIAMART